MNKNEFGRSVQPHQETSLNQMYRDTRKLETKIYEALFLPRVTSILYILFGTLTLLVPAAWPISILLSIILWFTVLGHTSKLPFNVPFMCKQKDPHDPKPGRRGLERARGVVFLGNAMATAEELYLSFDALLRHLLIFGTTGAGKTEAFLGFCFNFLSISSGFIFNDAKASPTLGVQVYTMCRYFGVDDDYNEINYLKSDGSANPDPAMKLSNDSAPFAYGSADSCTQLVISLMPQEQGGSNAVFSQRAVALIHAIMPALTELRDKGMVLIDPDVIRVHMEYSRVTGLMANPNISVKARRAIVAFVKSLSGYNENKAPNKQPEEVTKQFGYAQSYFTRALAGLSDTYGHIYMSGSGEVDFKDILLNDRVLTTLLPSLQKSGEELQNLGKIVLSGIKSAISSGLGFESEGATEDLLDSLPMATNKPFGIFNDEYAYIAVEGFAITAAQARGLNVCLGFGGQDYAGWKNAIKDEAEQIVANCRFKYIMALEDAGSTLELVKKVAGETWISLTSGHEVGKGLSSRYTDGLKASMQKVDRIDPQDLKKLDKGEGFGIYMDKVILMRNFWHGFDRNNMVTQKRLGRRIQCDFRPKRGPMKELLATDGSIARYDIELWARNINRKIDTSFLTTPKIFDNALKELRKVDTRNYLTAAEDALYFIGYSVAKETQSDIPEGATENGGNLFKAIGNFGIDDITDDDGDDISDEEMAKAVQDVDSFFANLEIDNDKPIARDLDLDGPEEDNSSAGLTPPNAESDDAKSLQFKSLQQSLFSNTARQTIIKGVAKIERSLGNSEKDAINSAETVADKALESTLYPTNPRPEKNSADKEKLTRTLMSLSDGDEED
jgi:intracellular multiplication protein IcmO